MSILDRQTWTRSRGWRARIVLWAVFVVVVAALLVAWLSSREPTSESNDAFSLDFPSGFSEAQATKPSFAISRGKTTVALVPSPNSGRTKVTVSEARRRVRRFSCGGTPRIVTSNGQRAVAADARRRCPLFGSTAIVFGTRYRVLLSCDAPQLAEAAEACSATLEGLRVK